MTTVETRVVNPVNRSSVDSVPVNQSDLVDVAIKQEEDQIIVDDEISSSEGMDLENQMLTVALVKSVVDATPNGDKKESQSSRYGLRKRRRPGDVSSAEQSPTQHVPEAASLPPPLNPPPSGALPGPALKILKTTAVKIEKEQRPLQPPLKPQGMPIPPTYQAHKPIATKEAIPVDQPLVIKDVAHASRGTKIKDHPILGKLQNGVTLAPGNIARPSLMNHVKPLPAATKKKPATAKRTPKNAPRAMGAAIKQELVPTLGYVPNPLLQSTPPPAGIPRSYAHRQTGASGTKAPAAVPCPLPPPVPCPLQPDSMEAPVTEKKKVTISEPPVQGRPRIFSLDLDPSTFDFSDMAGDHHDNTGSSHGDVPPAEPSDLGIFQRDRAFSFEFFNFTGDELLPAVTQSSELTPPGVPSVFSEVPPLPRPRGDSIIFDPVSFQDGGIHEKNALLKAKGSLEPTPEAPVLSSESRLPPVPKIVTSDGRLPNKNPSAPNALPQYSAVQREAASKSGQIATLPSSLSNVSPSNVNSPATFQMELLNKDGRIGIYLPEARKARIARFHAKRKMRIWRKRIKYDCRKKLADSRPRIKGRFVKRSDMEDE